MKFGSRYEKILASIHRSAPMRILAAALATALATGLILAFSAPSSSGSGASPWASRLVPSPAARPAQVAVAGKTYQARVVGYDQAGDIALIRLRGAARLPTVPVGNSSLVKVGQSVVALGNAGGQAVVAVSPGTLTKLDRTVTATDQVGTASSETLHGMMQASAGLVAGDSGGPLSDTSGVIGMDTASGGLGYQQGIGYAIPINTALSVAGQIAAGKASPAITIGYPPFLGAFVGTGPNRNPLDQGQREQSRQSAPPAPVAACYTSNASLSPPSVVAPVNSGILGRGVVCASPAARAGLTSGAVITAVNGQRVASPEDLSHAMGRFRPGDTISVTWVTASGTRMTGRVHLTAGPPL